MTKQQDKEGILSPLIRDIRLRKVAAHIPKNSVVLDIACASGRLKAFLPQGCQYHGVDRALGIESDQNDDFLELDILADASFGQIQQWLPAKPDCIACAAFLEHLENPLEFVQKYKTLLQPNGRFIGTTPHPCARLIHEHLARISLCSHEASDEHKTFLGKQEIKTLATMTNGKLSRYGRFLFGLNQFFVIEYPAPTEHKK